MFKLHPVVSLALAAGLLLPLSANATPNFPAALQSELLLSQEPSCAVCHQGEPTSGTATTPLGSDLRAHGLMAYDEDSLLSAVQALRTEKTDGDGDGVSDVDELVAGTDPNLGAEASPLLPEPTYGCNASSEGLGLLALVGALLALVPSRRRARVPKQR